MTFKNYCVECVHSQMPLIFKGAKFEIYLGFAPLFDFQLLKQE